MKSLVLILVFFSSNLYASKLYLVTSHEPHLLSELYPHVNIIKSKGRTLLVTIKAKAKLTTEMKNSLQSISKEDVLNYKPVSTKELVKSPTVEALISDVSAERMKAITEKVASFGKRKSGTDDNVNAAIT